VTPRVARAFDALAVAILLLLPFQGWHRAGAVSSGWRYVSDRYITGPDSASWAENAVAFAQGRYGDLDDHRMPTWTLLTGITMTLTHLDVASAGHLLNRGMHLLLGPAVYALGRAVGLRGAAFAAAAMVAFHPALLSAAAVFGVDPTVELLVVATLLSARVAGRWWWFAPVAGMIGGLTATAHLTAIAFWVTGAAMCVFTGRAGWRWLALLLYLGSAALTVYAVYRVFPLMPRDMVTDVFAEGISTTAGNTSPAAAAASRAAALQTLQANAPRAVTTALNRIVTEFHLGTPWTFSIALFWAGLLGPRAFQPGEHVLGAPRWKERLRWAARSVGEGLPLVLACAPMVALAAANAPARYSQNLLPVGILLLARGASTMVAGVHAAGLRFRWWRLDAVRAAMLAEGVLALGCVLRDQADDLQRAPLPRQNGEDPAEQALQLGKVLAERFPAGGGAASILRDPLPYAGMPYCPHTACPMSATEQGFAECITIMRHECQGDGPIPYVVIDALPNDQLTPARRAMDAWITAASQPIAISGDARIYAIPRTGAYP
jgi:hypothetical protein